MWPFRKKKEQRRKQGQVRIYDFEKKKAIFISKRKTYEHSHIFLNDFEEGPDDVRGRDRRERQWWLRDERLYLSCHICGSIYLVEGVSVRRGLVFESRNPICVHCPSCGSTSWPYLLDFPKGRLAVKDSKSEYRLWKGIS